MYPKRDKNVNQILFNTEIQNAKSNRVTLLGFFFHELSAKVCLEGFATNFLFACMVKRAPKSCPINYCLGSILFIVRILFLTNYMRISTEATCLIDLTDLMKWCFLSGTVLRITLICHI